MATDDLMRKYILAADESRAVREMIQDWAIIKMGKGGDWGKLMGQ